MYLKLRTACDQTPAVLWHQVIMFCHLLSLSSPLKLLPDVLAHLLLHPRLCIWDVGLQLGIIPAQQSNLDHSADYDVQEVWISSDSLKMRERLSASKWDATGNDIGLYFRRLTLRRSSLSAQPASSISQYAWVCQNRTANAGCCASGRGAHQLIDESVQVFDVVCYIHNMRVDFFQVPLKDACHPCMLAKESAVL